MRRVIGVLAAVTVLSVGTGCGDDKAAEASGSTLRFVVTELKGLEELQREFGAFQETFEKESGLKLKFFPVSSRAAAAAALDADRADLVFTGPAEYVALQARVGVSPVVAIERPGYSSCIYTSRESGVKELGDLAGTKVAMEDVGSTSAHLGPSLILDDIGIDPQSDVEVVLVGDAMHEALVRGDVAAVGAGCHDYEEFVAEDERDEFPVLARGEQLPADVIVGREGLDQETVDTIRATFEEHWPALREAMLEGEENQKFSDARIVAVPNDKDYDPVRAMYRAVGVDDYSEFVGEE